MIKMQNYLTEREVKLLRTQAKRLGIPLSEMIRRALDYYITQEMWKTVSPTQEEWKQFLNKMP